MFWEKLSKKEKFGLSIAMTFLTAALLDRFIISPIKNRFRQINQKIEISEKKLGSALRNLKQKEFITAEYQKYIDYVKKSGSDEEEVAKVLAEIEALARKSSVYLVNTKPQKPREVDFYKEYAVEIETEGDMPSLINFLHQLNTSPLLLRADKLRLSPKARESTVLKASMLITKVLVP